MGIVSLQTGTTLPFQMAFYGDPNYLHLGISKYTMEFLRALP